MQSMAVKGGAQYDSVGSKYASFKRGHKPAPEEHTMRCLLGRLDGARVLDLACGLGHYSRLAKDLGASSVVGVDISGLKHLAAFRERVAARPAVKAAMEAEGLNK